MDRRFHIFLVFKAILVVTITGLGMFLLSTMDGLPGIVLGFVVLYIAFFISLAVQAEGRDFRHTDRRWSSF